MWGGHFISNPMGGHNVYFGARPVVGILYVGWKFHEYSLWDLNKIRGEVFRKDSLCISGLHVDAGPLHKGYITMVAMT